MEEVFRYLFTEHTATFHFISHVVLFFQFIFLKTVRRRTTSDIY